MFLKNEDGVFQAYCDIDSCLRVDKLEALSPVHWPKLPAEWGTAQSVSCVGRARSVHTCPDCMNRLYGAET